MAKNNVIDLNLGGSNIKRIRIDGSDDNILVLDTADFNFYNRLKEREGVLFHNYGEDFSGVDETDTDAVMAILSEADDKIREALDYVFLTNVSDICIGKRSCFDVLDDGIRYLVILNNLIDIMSAGTEEEAKKMKTKIAKHTEKYTQGK